ncbi:FG-GAP repeat domain-containing protein [Shimia aestuarii]|uniref:Repeat domain-containing protein n=1 Tax=Shimia aestuarii TaxID=254406 RepID=A0A1I4RDK4_9RHOB|nr:VCBS repeat-containing protein [Shimia aestuarii]SFM50354.1 Repeat domain-containing protein [Shimia aestuarii]
MAVSESYTDVYIVGFVANQTSVYLNQDIQVYWSRGINGSRYDDDYMDAYFSHSTLVLSSDPVIDASDRVLFDSTFRYPNYRFTFEDFDVTPGTYWLGLIVDARDEVDEGPTGEANNISAPIEIEIHAPALNNGFARGRSEFLEYYWDRPFSNFAEFLVGDFRGNGGADGIGLVAMENGARFVDMPFGDTLRSFNTAVIGGRDPNPMPVYEDQTWLVADFDGNGIDDILALYDVRGEVRQRVYLGEGKTGAARVSFQAPEIWTGREALPYDNVDHWLTGDFNGDGNADVLALYGVRGDVRQRVYLSEGDGFGDAFIWSAATPTEYASNQRWLTGDFDGDGLDDVVVIHGAGGALHQQVFLSEADGFADAADWLPDVPMSFWSAQTWLADDFNGDGLDDLVAIFQTNPDDPERYFRVYLSEGDGFANPRNWAPNQVWAEPFEEAGWATGDVNNDGAADILRFYGNVWENTYVSGFYSEFVGLV